MLAKILSAEELCICGKKLGGDTLILIESGQMRASKKDARFLRFYPDWQLPEDQWSSPGDPESVLRIPVHFECFRELFNQADMVWRVNPRLNECQVCSLDFNKSRWAHRYTMGEIVNGTFEPDPEMPRRGIVCSFCAEVIAQEPRDSLQQPERGQLTLL